MSALFYSASVGRESQDFGQQQYCIKEEKGRPEHMIFGEGGIHALKHLFFQKVSTSLLKPLPVTRNSHHHEGFQCFARYGEL